MQSRGKKILVYFTLVVVSLFFLFSGLIKAKSFLAPLAIAALLAMVVLPIGRWFENKGINRAWASFFSDLIVLIFFIGMGAIVGVQVKSVAKRWPQIKERIEPAITQLQEFIASKTGLTIPELNEQIPLDITGSAGNKSQGISDSSNQSTTQKEKANPESSGDTPSSPQGSSVADFSSMSKSIYSTAGTFLINLFGFLGTFLLIFVYIFFFLLYRHKFKMFILKLVPSEKRNTASEVVSKSANIAQNYLFGRLLLILFLGVLYSVGLIISGVDHAILVSAIAALLSLLPYIGNLIAFCMAITMAFISGSGINGAIGVTITYTIAQFVESYILEPYIVGDKVELNPIFTIIVVVLGGTVWGVTGMLISIPALGMVKIVFDHIPALQPYAYLFGQEETDSGNNGNIFSKTKRWALNKFK